MKMQPPVVWITGLPASGKTTLARALALALAESGLRVEVLDGDDIRRRRPGTGFGRADRDAHVLRVGFEASQLQKKGVWAIAALISPYEESRQSARGLCGSFVQVYLNTPIEECERRDPKGLYRMARRGDIRQFTGVSDPYEPPLRPDFVIDTRFVTPEEAARRILESIRAKKDA